MAEIPFYSDGFDMKGARGLRVEARLLGEAPPSPVSIRVQGTDSGVVAKDKSWADEGPPIDIFGGTEYSSILRVTHGVVRVVAEPLVPVDLERVKVRLTRLP